MDDIMTRMTTNPLPYFHDSFFEKEVFAIDKYYLANVRVIRGYFENIIADKKEQLKAGEKSCDIVTLLL